MTIACPEALDLVKRSADDEIAAYEAYIVRYRENAVKRELSKRKAYDPMRAASALDASGRGASHARALPQPP
jgi:hypothetical protein